MAKVVKMLAPIRPFKCGEVVYYKTVTGEKVSAIIKETRQDKRLGTIIKIKVTARKSKTYAYGDTFETSDVWLYHR